MEHDRPIIITSVGDDFPELKVPGLSLYYGRDLLRGANTGTVMCPTGDAGDLACLYGDYAPAGLGPPLQQFPCALAIPNSSLYAALLRHGPSMQWLRSELETGRKIQFFSSSAAAVDFVGRAGLNWDQHVSNAAPEVAGVWNSKALLRQRISEHYFPSHTLVNHSGELGVALSLKHGCSALRVLKVPGAASSEGMIFFKAENPPTTWQLGFPAIVEDAYPHIPFSVVFDIDPPNGPRFCYVSRQILDTVGFDSYVTEGNLLRGGISHRGNIVGSLEQRFGDVGGYEFSIQMEEYLTPLMQVVYHSGYRGLLCIDLMQTKDGKIFVLECNARTSNSMYADNVRRVVEPQFSGNVVVVMANITVPKSLTSYEMARGKIERLLYQGNGKAGLLMYHTLLLPLGLGKAGLVALAPDYFEALRIFGEGERLLRK